MNYYVMNWVDQTMETLIPQPPLPAQTPKSDTRRGEGGGGGGGGSRGASPQPSSRDSEGIKDEDFDTILQNKCPIVPLHRTALAQEPNPLARHGNQLKEIAQHHHARVSS